LHGVLQLDHGFSLGAMSGMQSLRQDVLCALWVIRHNPGSAAGTILTLALGIGANTAILSVLDGLVLRILPVWQPDHLVQVMPIYRYGATVPLSCPMFHQLNAPGKVVFTQGGISVA
jgi:hypothetical protein